MENPIDEILNNLGNDLWTDFELPNDDLVSSIVKYLEGPDMPVESPFDAYQDISSDVSQDQSSLNGSLQAQLSQVIDSEQNPSAEPQGDTIQDFRPLVPMIQPSDSNRQQSCNSGYITSQHSFNNDNDFSQSSIVPEANGEVEIYDEYRPQGYPNTIAMPVEEMSAYGAVIGATAIVNNGHQSLDMANASLPAIQQPYTSKKNAGRIRSACKSTEGSDQPKKKRNRKRKEIDKNSDEYKESRLRNNDSVRKTRKKKKEETDSLHARCTKSEGRCTYLEGRCTYLEDLLHCNGIKFEESR